MIEPTDVSLPASLIYPIEIVGILEGAGSSVSRHRPLVRYKYWVEIAIPGSEEDDSKQPPETEIKEQYSVFESPIEGEIVEWKISIGDSVPNSKTTIVSIAEPCTHPVQFGGLCAVCGQTLDNADYSEYDNKQRAPISMAHDTSGLQVSYAEAARIEKSLEKQLQEKRKLILVVDLDQTVIQAAVDPAIKEWMDDESNPNHEAVKDVQTFCLEESALPKGAPAGTRPMKTQCWYYVKMRPGLSDFLRDMNQIYEMHVYTMATRAYASAIAKIIDPKGIYFSDRILSRDESGSLTQKNLQRLFPVSTSMVAIIDDRGDVWNWSANLIKVVPYNFFVGTGDINSNFLPQKTGELKSSMKEEKENGKSDSTAEVKIKEVTQDVEMQEQPAQVEQKHDDAKKLEEDNGSSEIKSQEEGKSTEVKEDEAKSEETTIVEADLSIRPSKNPKAERALIDKDNELFKLDKVLKNIHDKFYQDFDRSHGKVEPDLKVLIPKIKSKVFDGCIILFSGVIPLGASLDSVDIVQWVRSFGAVVVGDFVDSVTHVVGTSKGTAKVRQAIAKKGRDSIHIVYSDWVMTCLGEWKRVPEEKYEMKFSAKELEMIQRSAPSAVDVEADLDINEDSDEFGSGEFMQSLNQSNMNWEDIDKELEEFMGGDDDDDEDGDDEDSDNHETVGQTKKREREDDTDDERKKVRVEFPDDDENGSDDDQDDSSIDEEFLKELENDLM